MPLPDFTVAIWVMPHRAHGYMVEIDSDLVDDDVPGGIWQSFKDVKDPQNPPQLLPQFAHREFMVSADQVRALINMADRISYSFTEPPFTGMLGGATYGLRVSRSYQEATIVWRGDYEDQEQSIRELFAAIQVLAEG